MIYPLINIYNQFWDYTSHEKAGFDKRLIDTEVWREATLTMAILKNPNMQLKQAIVTYLYDKQNELSLSNEEFNQCVDVLIEHATFKGLIWINLEYEKSRNLKEQKDFLGYGPLNNDLGMKV